MHCLVISLIEYVQRCASCITTVCALGHWTVAGLAKCLPAISNLYAYLYGVHNYVLTTAIHTM